MCVLKYFYNFLKLINTDQLSKSVIIILHNIYIQFFSRYSRCVVVMFNCERENVDCQVVASLRPTKRRTTCRLNISFIKQKCKRRSALITHNMIWGIY